MSDTPPPVPADAAGWPADTAGWGADLSARTDTVLARAAAAQRRLRSAGGTVETRAVRLAVNAGGQLTDVAVLPGAARLSPAELSAQLRAAYDRACLLAAQQTIEILADLTGDAADRAVDAFTAGLPEAVRLRLADDDAGPAGRR